MPSGQVDIVCLRKNSQYGLCQSEVLGTQTKLDVIGCRLHVEMCAQVCECLFVAANPEIASCTSLMIPLLHHKQQSLHMSMPGVFDFAVESWRRAIGFFQLARAPKLTSHGGPFNET